MTPKFVELHDDDQTGALAQLLLDSTPPRRAVRAETQRRERDEVALARRAGGEPETPLFSFGRFTLPVIAAMFGCTPVQELVAVQPMSGPTPTLFSFESLTGEWVRDIEAEFETALRATLLPGEELHAYRYGGVLAERGGYFVARGERVLRYVQTVIS